jgi:hypothetical protein
MPVGISLGRSSFAYARPPCANTDVLIYPAGIAKVDKTLM